MKINNKKLEVTDTILGNVEVNSLLSQSFISVIIDEIDIETPVKFSIEDSYFSILFSLKSKLLTWLKRLPAKAEIGIKINNKTNTIVMEAERFGFLVFKLILLNMG